MGLFGVFAGLFRSKPYWTRAIVDRHVGDVDGGSGTLSKSNPSPRQSSRPACAYDTRSIKSAEILDNFIFHNTWFSEDIQKVRNEFCKIFAYTKENWKKTFDVEIVLLDILIQVEGFLNLK